MSETKKLSCTITVSGNGTGGHGRPKTTKSGPLRDFLVDNTVYYLAVTKHLQKCDVCDIADVLKEYLRRRVEVKKFDGSVSTGLLKRAVILENLAAKKRTVLPPGLVNEFVWRHGPYGIVMHPGRLSLREKVRAFSLSSPDVARRAVHRYKCGKSVVEVRLPPGDIVLADLVAAGLDFEGRSDEDIERLIAVGEVTAA